MAGQLPRPWFRLGSMTRPTTATTTAPIPDQPRPVPPRVRPPIIRPAALTEPVEPTTPQRSKSPHHFPHHASPAPTVKNATSPPRVLPSPSNGRSGGTATASPSANPSTPKGRSSSVVGSPTTNNSKQPSPFLSPSIPKSIPTVPTPYQSPKPKATSSPPSPLILPPPQLQSVGEPKHETIPQEVERKTVVYQKVMDKTSQAEHHVTNIHNNATEFEQNGKQESKKSDENQISKDKGGTIEGNKKAAFESSIDNTRVITMAGENKGAFMEIVMSSDKNINSRHEQQNQAENNVINSPKGNKSKKKITMGGSKTRNVVPMKAFFNSNVQGINNSILMDSKFTHHDPGIHLVFSSIPPSTDDEDDQEHQ